ncbi:hypothetical protein NDI52_27550 [Leptolyngbya sp. PL-A3]
MARGFLLRSAIASLKSIHRDTAPPPIPLDRYRCAAGVFAVGVLLGAVG